MGEKVSQQHETRMPPGAVSVEAEQAVLGALLSDDDAWKNVEDLWSEDLFAADPAHAAIARALESMARAHRKIDAVLLQVELDRRGELGRVVPQELPLGLARAVGSTANVRYYVEVLRELRAKRGAAPDGLDQFSLRHALQVEEGLEDEQQRTPTGWGRLDDKLAGGLAIPSLNVLGAAPKSGKSTWAAILAERHVERGGFAYVLDLENGRKLFLRRMIARRARIGLADLLTAMRQKRQGIFKTRDEVDRWVKAKAEIAEKCGSRLFMEFNLQKHEDLALRIAAVRRRAKNAPLLVVIDSLQKLPMKLEERRASVDFWLRRLERLRTEQNVVIVLISEIKRGDSGYEAREDTFKESGGVEYTADLGLTLTRASADGDEKPDEVSTLRVVFARDSEEDPRGAVACYRPQRPWYGLEEGDVPGKAAPARDGSRKQRPATTPRLFPEEGAP